MREKEKEEFEGMRDGKEKGGGGITDPGKGEENLTCEFKAQKKDRGKGGERQMHIKI